jgi:hypothetical protein
LRTQANRIEPDRDQSEHEIMSLRVDIANASALLLFTTLSFASSSNAPTTPSPSPPAAQHPVVAVASITINADRANPGYTYTVSGQLHETAGVAASIVSLDLTLLTARLS